MRLKHAAGSLLIAGGLAAAGWVQLAAAQDAKPEGKSAVAQAGGKGDAGLPVAAPGDQVVIKRDAVQLIDPQRYRTPLYLSPIKTVTLVAPHEGVVRSLTLKIGDYQSAQTEVAKLDNPIQKFQLQRAQSLYKVAVLEQKLAADGASGEQKELAQAKVDAAKADVELAQYRADQSSLRLPSAGEVLRFLVAEGQFVKAGDPVAVVGDTSKLQVEIPADRGEIDRAKTFPLKVEGTEAEARVEAVLPLDKKFDALRELFDSLTSAVLVLDNAKRNYLPGQTVIVPLIPRHPVAEVASGAIGNRPDGGRKVQVLREGVVRDVSVSLMGSVGLDRLFVSGPFAQGDEVIFEASHLLADGFPVRPSSGKPRKTEGEKGTGKPDKPAATGTGF